MKAIRFLFIISLVFLSNCKNESFINKTSTRDNWLCYQHDFHNSSVSAETVAFPLTRNWTFDSGYLPNPAWPEPAKQDYWHNVPKLSPLITYDRTFHVAMKDGGVYFASSANNSVYCIDEKNGRKMWQFFTEGPNRTAPTLDKDKLYVGSDDGYLYCLNNITGKLIWKYKPATNSSKIMGNGRLISHCPIRTAPIIHGDTLFIAAGLFPKQEVYIVALDKNSGNVFWKTRSDDLSAQGYPVISNGHLYVPSSRSKPRIFDTKTGEKLGVVKSGPGGDFISIVDGKLRHGVSNRNKIDAEKFLRTAFSGHKIKFSQGKYFIASEYYLTAIDTAHYSDVNREKEQIIRERQKLTDSIKSLRKNIQSGNNSLSSQLSQKIGSLKDVEKKIAALNKKQYLWRVKCDNIRAMLLTKNSIVIGKNNELIAFDFNTGKMLWKSNIEGNIYGLALSNGKLIASTDTGKIICFSESKEKYNLAHHEKELPKQSDKYSKAAETILDNFTVKKGICLIPDLKNGNLAIEILKQSNMNIIAFCQDDGLRSKLQNTFNKVNLYGTRITILNETLETTDISNYLVNLVIFEEMPESGKMDFDFNLIKPLLKPDGGKLILGQSKNNEQCSRTELEDFAAAFNIPAEDFNINEDNGIWFQYTRPALEHSGEWTHLYANPENTANSNDNLVNDHLVPLWFGKPGPRNMVDRHHRMVPPLYKNGIVYIPGYCQLSAADAYNGTLLWTKVLPNFNRLGIFRDACNYVVSDEYLYVVNTDRTTAYHPVTGKQLKEFVIPQLSQNNTRYWGYLTIIDDLMLGSGRKPQAEFTNMGWQQDNELWYDYQRSVTSEYLFCKDRFTGENLWQYKKGIILNPSITVGNGRIYFLESKNESALQDEDGLLQMEQLLSKKCYITALDIKTGQKLWRQPFEISAKRHHLFLVYSDEMLMCVCSKNKNNSVSYDTYGYKANTGEFVWHQEQINENFVNGGHGEQHRHPIIVEDRIFVEPYSYNLYTGEKLDNWKIERKGHGCGTISASNNNIFYRAGNPAFCNLEGDESTNWINSVTRPGCWINIIPAGGIVMIPEASSGCTCDFPLQTSITYRPMSKALDISLNAEKSVKNGQRKIQLSTLSGNGEIHFTLDGSEPTEQSNIYNSPVFISESSTLKAIAFYKGQKGRLREQFLALYSSLGKKVTLLTDYSEKYSASGPSSITDGNIGSGDIHDPGWQGYNGNDFIAVIDMETETNIQEINCRFANYPKAWVFAPKAVKISVSNDGNHYTSVAALTKNINRKKDVQEILTYSKSFDNLNSRYIKIEAENFGILPDWHSGKGNPSWLFVDEVIVK